MRWVSNHESAARGEVSVLAIVETLIAISISLWIAWYYDTTLYILISACIAPFLLLRTEESTELGLKWFRVFDQKTKSFVGDIPEDFEGLCKIFLFLIPAYVIGSMFVKILATSLVFLKNPVLSTKEIPKNWWNNAMSTDFFAVPEIIPGVELHADYKDTYVLSSYLKNNMTVNDFSDFMSSLFSFSFIILPLYIAPILYRFSLKATSIIYLPFIWIINPPKQDGEEKTKLDLIKESQFEKVKRFYSWFVLLVLTAVPIALHIIWYKAQEAAVEIPILLDYFAPIESIDSWHITRALAAILTLVMFYFIADRVLIKLKNKPDLSLGSSLFLLNVLGKLRLVFTLWTIVCGLYILYGQVDWTGLEVNWLPDL